MFIFLATVPFVFSEPWKPCSRARRYVEARKRWAPPAPGREQGAHRPALPSIYNNLRNLFGLAFGYIMRPS